MSPRQQVSAPTSYLALREAIISRWVRLPRRMRQVGAYLLDHPEEVAFGSVLSIAKSAQVASSALVRFGQAFGLAGFSDLQALCQSELSARVRAVPSLHPLDDIVASGALGDTARRSLAALDAICTPQTEIAIQTAAAALAGAETIYIVATGRSYAAGLLANSVFRDAGIRSQMATRVDMDVIDVLSAAKSADAVLEIDLASTPLAGSSSEGRRIRRVVIVTSARARAYARADTSILIGSGTYVSINAIVTVHALTTAILERIPATITNAPIRVHTQRPGRSQG